ncbi:MAG: TspO/MBR family protein [Fuerstiella sp.]
MTGSHSGVNIKNQTSSHLRSLIVFVVLCFLTASAGAAFPPGEWYAGLNRPWYAPPNWLFGPVWTMLYFMIAFSGWLVWKARNSADSTSQPKINLAMMLYSAQLVLNSAWTYLFFGLQRPDIALAEILVLWVMIIATIFVFRRHSMPAAVLLVPYLLWVSFASVLNYGFWSLNS